jgi:hypothetical protein
VFHTVAAWICEFGGELEVDDWIATISEQNGCPEPADTSAIDRYVYQNGL